MATPSTLSYGIVVGQFLVSASDSSDADALPDAVPASGTVTFTPSAGVVLDYGTTPNPSAILRKPIVATLDAEGYITGADGTRGIKLIATDNPTVKPVGWTWVATYALTDPEGSPLRTLTTHPFFVPSDVTTDLVVAMPIEESKGVFLSKGDKGDKGDNNVLTISSVTVGEPSVTITGDSPNQQLAISLPVNALEIGDVVTGEPVDGAADIPEGVMVYRGRYSLGGSIYFEDGNLPAGLTSDRTPVITNYTDLGEGTTKALMFADITNSQSTWMEYPLTSEGDITVRFEMQTEATFDPFKIFLDGVLVQTYSGTRQIADEVIPATAGDHVLRFEFSKDSSASAGYDNVKISAIKWEKTIDPYVLGNVVYKNGVFYTVVVDTATESPSSASTQWSSLSAPLTPITMSAPTGMSGTLTFNKDNSRWVRASGTLTNTSGADIVGPKNIGYPPSSDYYALHSAHTRAMARNTTTAWDENSVVVVIYHAYAGNPSPYQIAIPAGQTLKAGVAVEVNLHYKAWT